MVDYFIGQLSTVHRWFFSSYFSPRLLKCCPIRRTMSRSVCDIILIRPVSSVPSWISPFVAGPEQAPFIWTEVDGTILSSVPLCWGEQPLVCIVFLVEEVQRRCFLRGGAPTPPSSLSDDEARLAALWLEMVLVYNTNALHWICERNCENFWEMSLFSPSLSDCNIFFILLGDVIGSAARWFMGKILLCQNILPRIFLYGSLEGTMFCNAPEIFSIPPRHPQSNASNMAGNTPQPECSDAYPCCGPNHDWTVPLAGWYEQISGYNSCMSSMQQCEREPDALPVHMSQPRHCPISLHSQHQECVWKTYPWISSTNRRRANYRSIWPNPEDI